MEDQENSTNQQNDQASSKSTYRSGFPKISKFFTNYHITVEPALFLALSALYIELPSIQDLIYTKICSQVIANHSVSNGSQYYDNEITDSYKKALLVCERSNKSLITPDIRSEISSQNSIFWLKYEFIICFLCAISCPHWGGISDKLGRIFPLNAPAIAGVMSNLLYLAFGILLSLQLQDNIFSNIEWLYLGAVLTGVSGGQGNLIVNSFSYISDSSTPQERSKRVTVLESVMFLAHSIGFYIAKLVMSSVPLDRPWFNRHFVAFLTCISINLACILYSTVRFRKTIMVGSSTNSEHLEIIQKNDPGQTQSINNDTQTNIAAPENLKTKRAIYFTLNYYKETFLAATKARESRKIILLLLSCAFISAMSLACLAFLLYSYLAMEPFSWNTSQYSSWNSKASVSQGLALIILTLSMRFSKSWNIPDALVAIIGYSSKGAGLMMIALAQSPSIINWSLLASILSEYSMPPIRSLLSKQVANDEVAKIYSCIATMQSICFLAGNVVIYFNSNRTNILKFFRTSFLVVSCFQFIAVILMILIYILMKKNNNLVG